MLEKITAGLRPEAFEVVAHGRLNLIGVHTDYDDGLVLPMAIEKTAGGFPGSTQRSRQTCRPAAA